MPPGCWHLPEKLLDGSKWSDKHFQLNSMQINAELGGRMLEKFPGLQVDIHHPDFVLSCEIREEAYLYVDRMMAVGGMPVGTAGRTTLLLSGGIDSPVAGYMLAKRGVELEAVDLAANTVTFSAYAVPKTYVEGMAVEFLAENGETASDRLGSVGEEGPNQRFSATLSVPLTDHITLSALLVPPDGTRQTQLLDQFEGLYSASLPQVEVNSDLMWMDLEDSTLVLNASSHERYVYIREVTPADASLTAAVANIRVGLFKNQKLAAWAEPCEKPDSFHGFEEFDFYQLPELRLSLTPADTVQVAAVVTDIYGRVMVSQDVPYILDESGDALTWPDSSETDPDPAHWQYGG